jgi:hypothetical protein
LRIDGDERCGGVCRRSQVSGDRELRCLLEPRGERRFDAQAADSCAPRSEAPVELAGDVAEEVRPFSRAADLGA